MGENYNLISQLKIDDNETDFFLFRFNYSNNENPNELKIFEYLQEIAKSTKQCFNTLAPYEDIYQNIMVNREYFVLYHLPSNKVFGWTNVILSVINNNGEFFYTLKIDKIVIISNFGGLPNIGSFMIKYILDLFTKNCLIHNAVIDTFENIQIDYIYLYSLAPSIGFYEKNNDLVKLKEIKTEDEIPQSDKIFFYYPHITEQKIKQIKAINRSLNDLHTFDADEVDIADLPPAKPINRDCRNNSIIISNFKTEIFDFIQQIKSKTINYYTLNQTKKTRQIRASRPATRTTTRTSTRPVTRTTTRPVTRPTTRPVTRTTTRPVTIPTTRPVTRTTTRPVTIPVTRPVKRHTIQPTISKR